MGFDENLKHTLIKLLLRGEKMMIQDYMSKKKLIELLKNVPDDVAINVLNKKGEYTANIEFWFEDLETRKFVILEGKDPFWKMNK